MCVRTVQKTAREKLTWGAGGIETVSLRFHIIHSRIDPDVSMETEDAAPVAEAMADGEAEALKKRLLFRETFTISVGDAKAVTQKILTQSTLNKHSHDCE